MSKQQEKHNNMKTTLQNKPAKKINDNKSSIIRNIRISIKN